MPSAKNRKMRHDNTDPMSGEYVFCLYTIYKHAHTTAANPIRQAGTLILIMPSDELVRLFGVHTFISGSCRPVSSVYTCNNNHTHIEHPNNTRECAAVVLHTV